MQLSNFDVTAFLKDYWQQKPLLIRSAWDCWTNPVDPDELAGLACEPLVESRIITRRDHAWELEHGPVPESRFAKAGRDPWTLLVQSVDHHLPSVAALLDPFRFVPNWRIDDVMVSYAVDGGGVGAHFDHYDVFLVQGLGRRRWEVGALCDDDTELLAHDGLRLLADFQATEEWILEPGDMLYVPPRVAHRGVAIGDDCMTYSIGFRAPSRAELIEAWADDMIPDLSDSDRYADPHLLQQDNPGEISAEALAQLQAMIAETLLDKTRFARWFGQYNTTPKNPEIDWRPEHAEDADDVQQRLAAGMTLVRNPASRFSLIRETDTSLLLFVDGLCIACSDDTARFAERVCAETELAVPSNSAPATLEVIALLVNAGSLAFEAED
ncbi:50S ribosomal protein L16 3-hydroxylase [Erythromicrobium ramosum]|uniref:50S ribosomal protein L16 3-hydroxylase n=1 Tax=Erythrobacter ramosus TaxID=35811 RepID=A0A6I4UI78_9SPHN|nr:cupin domain-containing protein [Erythrobacter ramosus]MBB3776326.1 50S ribosomal protein L16 3-hydroxylase [Erythrobacter ramosus]MXP38592.1 cupin domain-containing protein [Erythrobacter ramosus]